MISVVIPNLHSPLIDQVVQALECQTLRSQIADIVVVGQDRYGRVPANIRFVATEQPRSAAATRNLGASLVSSDYILFLDADCIAAPDLVERMLACHRQGYAVVSGGITIEAGNYWVLCDNLLAFASFLATAPAGTRDHLPSLNLSMQRHLFAEMGGFDERFAGAAGEDMDLSMRLRANGHVLYFEPAARITHRPQRTTAGAVWQHLRTFGRMHYLVQCQHAALSRSPLVRLHHSWAGLLIAAAPLLACRDVFWLLCRSREIYQHAPAWAGMIWIRIGWYWGVAEGLMVRAARDAEQMAAVSQ